MFSIKSLAASHTKLVVKLRKFSYPQALQLIASLGVCPELMSNTIRIEILTHLATAYCVGRAEPTWRDLKEWTEKLMADTLEAKMEDPIEDVFIGCVNTSLGSFKIFQGVFGDGAFIVEQLLAFIEQKTDFPPFEEAAKRALAILTLADSLVSRNHLTRYQGGSGIPGRRISLPRRRDMLQRISSVFFTWDDLANLGIERTLLSEFILNPDHRPNILEEVLWRSTLDRRPLIIENDGILITEPSALSRAAAYYLKNQIKYLGGFGEMFYQISNAEKFVNEVRSRLRIEPMGISHPTPSSECPPLFPSAGMFDVGKPALLLTYTPSFFDQDEDWDESSDRLNVEGSQVQKFIEDCAKQMEALPHFSGGLVLVCIATTGEDCLLSFHQWSDRWRIHVASLSDWLLLTSNNHLSAMRLWKLGDHEAAADRLGIKISNSSDLVNLIGCWEENGFRLIPQKANIQHQQFNLLSIFPDFAAKIRIQRNQSRDEHCVPSFTGAGFLKIARFKVTSEFSNERHLSIYCAFDEAHRRLVGCSKAGSGIWWVVAPSRPPSHEQRHLQYQLWDCLLNWVDRAVPTIEKDLLSLQGRSIKVEIELPDFEDWNVSDMNIELSELELPQVISDPPSNTIKILFPEGALTAFNVAENIAEKQIVRCIVEGASALAEAALDSASIEKLVKEIVSGDDARYFHIFSSSDLSFRDTFQGGGTLTFADPDDVNLSKLGLAYEAGYNGIGETINSRDKCQKILQDSVTRIWEKIEVKLGSFSRYSVISACFSAIHKTNEDESRWNLSTRSLLALYEDQEQTKSMLRSRRSRWAASNLCNRLLIETAQYACSENGSILSQADHLSLLADEILLTELAQHRDAVAFGFIAPQVVVHPNGELEVDMDLYGGVLEKYHKERFDAASEIAAKNYSRYFGSAKSSAAKVIPDEFEIIFQEEYGFTIDSLFEFSLVLRKLALESKSLEGVLMEEHLVHLLCSLCKCSAQQAEAFLNRLSLPIRSSWDSNFPPQCRKEDVYPWRFRRQLSVLTRPLVQITESPRSWIISAAFFERSISYLIGTAEAADFPERFFLSSRMKTYIGNKVNSRGHAFARKVFEVVSAAGLSAKLEIEMPALGASKNSGLGDVDVLAWHVKSETVFVIECKRLLPSLTVREIVQRLEDFKGDRKAKDSLGRHLRRYDYLKTNPDSLAKLTSIDASRLRIVPVLVTSEIVPMQFFYNLEFPADQVVPLGHLASFLNGLCGDEISPT